MNFWGPFYDDVIYKDDSYLSSNEEFKIKAKDLNFTLATFLQWVGCKILSWKLL